MSNRYYKAMQITDQAEADAYFEELVAKGMSETGWPRATIEDIVRQNLGYFAAYFSAETRERVERLYRCAHPVFGPIAEKGQPIAEQAFAMGKAYAERNT